MEPADEAANQNYAFLLMRADRYKAALERLQRLKKTKDSDLSVRVALVEAYLKSGLKTKGDGELDELLKSSIATDSDKLRIANLLLEDQEPDAAEKVPERSVSNQPDSAPAFWKLGLLFSKEGRYNDVTHAVRRAIELKPGEAQYYTFLTFLADTIRQEALLGKEKTAKTNEVIGLLEKALALDPTDTNAQVELALCYEKEGNLEKAESLLADAVRREPALRRAHLLLARVYGREGKTELAPRESQTITRLQAAEQEKRSRDMGTTRDGNR